MRGSACPFASRGVALPWGVVPLSLIQLMRVRSCYPAAPGYYELHAIGRTLFIAALVLAAALLHASGAFANEALLRAAQRGDAVEAQRLIKAGAAVDYRDARGRTPLLIATDENHIALARVLVAAGADVNARDQINDSPYLLAGARGRVDILKLTLANGADLRSVNRFGGTAMTPAAHYGHVHAVQVLLAAGVDPDHVNRLGWTALLEAVILGDGGARHTQIVRLLIGGGANVNLADGQGVTPLAHARSRGQSAIAAQLVAAGAR